MGPVSFPSSPTFFYQHHNPPFPRALVGSTTKRRDMTFQNCMRRTEADISPVGGIAICWGRLLPHHPLPYRLPLQASQGQLHHQNLPPQHQLQRQHLPRHSPRPMEPCVDSVERYAPFSLPLDPARAMLTSQSAAVDLLDVDGPEPRRPARPRDRPCIQDRPRQVRGDGP